MYKLMLKTLLAACLVMGAPFCVWAETEVAPEVNVQAITKNIYFLKDTAGMSNMVVNVGRDGVFMVDSKAAFLKDELLGALADAKAQAGAAGVTINPAASYLLNSHCHFDHVDGNRLFADTFTIIAHKTTYDYLTRPQQLAVLGGDPYPALTPETGLPDITFADIMDINFNDTLIQMLYLGPGHTGGDVVTIFTEENIIHVADLMFNGVYPYIGIDNGGSINSMIETSEKVAELMDDETVVVPGHGPISNKAQFLEWYAMLTKVRDNIAKAVAEGKTMAEVIAMKPTAEFDAVYGVPGGPLTVDQFVELCYMDLVRFK